MKNLTKQPLTIIIRSTKENTALLLEKQLLKQLCSTDTLLILDDEISFEEKLRKGFEEGMKINNTFTVFVDADILVRRNFLSTIRKYTQKINDNDLGFGFLLWDKFYQQPKFRGIHIYRSKFLDQAIQFIPNSINALRPETYVKNKFKEIGIHWRNEISHYIAGIHDYYQKPSDIYYKFLIRSKRSYKEVSNLLPLLDKNNNKIIYKMATKAIKDAKKLDSMVNDKYQYTRDVLEFDNIKTTPLYFWSSFIDIFILIKLLKRYGLRRQFWQSI